MITQTEVNSYWEGFKGDWAASEKNFRLIIGPFKGKLLCEEVRKAKPTFEQTFRQKSRLSQATP